MDTSHPLPPLEYTETKPKFTIFSGYKTYLTAAGLALVSVLATKYHLPGDFTDWLRGNMTEIVGFGIAAIGTFLRMAHKKATGV